MTKTIFTPVLVVAWLTGYAQEINPPEKMGGREVILEKTQCISDQQRAQIKAMLKANKERLIREGKLKPAEQSKTAAVKFNWPLKQMAAYDYNCYYGISNYVDHNVNYPAMLRIIIAAYAATMMPRAIITRVLIFSSGLFPG
jgi:hypothetical protein